MTLKLRVFALLAALLFAAVAFAQSYTASVSGTVRDSSSAVVPNASVVAVHVDTARRVETLSNAEGRYVLASLAPGRYRIEASAPGFKRAVRDGIVLEVQQQPRIDLVLALGEVSETVTVSAEVPLLESTTSSVGKVIDNRRMRELPLNTRNVYQLVFMAPGVAGSVGNQYNSLSYSVNGARGSMMDTIIDGVTASFPTVNGFTGISVFPSVDAIEEFKVMGSNYQAEFGRSLGSVLNVIFKSGTNQHHGSVYNFLRNSALDSNNFFNNRRGAPLTSFKRNQFGGMISGPIKRDRTFFLGSYEGLRERSLSEATFSVPTVVERTGDFSQTLAANGQLIRIFNPFTTRAAPGGGFVRNDFTGNRIPPNMLDPVAVNVMKYYPTPNSAGDPFTFRSNYSNSGTQLINLDQFDVRIDHSFSDKQKFFARYSHRLTQDIPPIRFGKELAIAEGRFNQENRVRGAVADYTHTLSPTMIFSGRLGFARTLYVYDNQGLGFAPSTLGLPRSLDANVDRLMFPRFGATDYVNIGGSDHRWNAFMSYTALANLTQIRGRHTLKYGFEGRLLRVNNWEARAAGTFNFNRAFTQGPNPNAASATAGSAIASLLLGTGTTGNSFYRGGWKNVAAQSFYYGFYLQDDYKLTTNLTLNLGVRYDLDIPRTERYNRMNHFDRFARSPLASQIPQFPNLSGGVVFVGVDGNSRHQYKQDNNNLAPRLGLAWQATPKTVVRAGYGHVFGPSNQGAQGTVGPNGFRSDDLWVSTLDGITPYHLLRDPYPNGFPPLPGASLGLLTQAGAEIQAPLPDTVSPWSMQWNFTVQRELPSQVLLEVAYVGTRGLHLSRNGEGGLSLNQLYPEHMALGSTLNQQVNNPFLGRFTTGLLAAPTTSRGQLLRPYPQFADIIPLYSSGASSTYHALQSSFRKRLSHGVDFAGSYTWAKILDSGMTHQNSYDLRSSRSLATIDVAHRFVMSVIYELPFGRGRRFGSGASRAVDALLGGWQINAIPNFQSGTPLTLTANNTAGLFNPVTRPNNNGKSGKLSGPVDQRLGGVSGTAVYFDRSVYSQPAPFTFGSVSPTLDIRNDVVRNFDFSLFKEFRPVERLTVQFRTELFNAFNTPRFGAPNLAVTSGSFGVITSQANAPRQIQFGLKLLW